MEQVNNFSVSTLKASLKSCIIEDGYFFHSNGEINTRWLDLGLLNRKLEEQEPLFEKALEILLKEVWTIQEISSNTIVFSTLPDRQLILFPHLIRDIIKGRNFRTAFVRKIAPRVYKIEGKIGESVILCCGLSVHKDIIGKSIDLIRSVEARIAGVLVLVHWGEHTTVYRDQAGSEYAYFYLYRIFEVEDELKIELNGKVKDKIQYEEV